jgi:hypothetical protein
MQDARETLIALNAARNRTGRDPMSDRDVEEAVRRIMESSLIFLEQCFISGTLKGSSAALEVFSRTRAFLDNIKGGRPGDTMNLSLNLARPLSDETIKALKEKFDETF